MCGIVLRLVSSRVKISNVESRDSNTYVVVQAVMSQYPMPVCLCAIESGIIISRSPLLVGHRIESESQKWRIASSRDSVIPVADTCYTEKSQEQNIVLFGQNMGVQVDATVELHAKEYR
jgi:hypothetical protein